MTQYTDLPQVQALYDESQRVTLAIEQLDAGADVAALTIGPPPATGPDPAPASGNVTIILPSPSPPDIVAQAKNWLRQREKDIARELEALGVTALPPERVEVKPA